MIRTLLLLLITAVTLPLHAAPEPPKSEPAIAIEITGDKEVPLVLYILPWQNPRAEMPDPPQLDDPALRPLTPCELGDSFSAEEVSAWQCDDRDRP
ncbi:hypothetical protein [Motiliproteus sediminis]|uniref:hypothetical protein n=1 Tax=Motiliproteus sediminis TaxID=1468178 RepID=UPI001AEF8C50|nr:hypothetical protein [Motiliproteus sediminis]